MTIDLAALVGDPACAASPQDTIEINYLATKALAEACKYNQINRFIFSSTCSVYGKGDGKLTEDSPLSIRDSYILASFGLSPSSSNNCWFILVVATITLWCYWPLIDHHIAWLPDSQPSPQQMKNYENQIHAHYDPSNHSLWPSNPGG